MVDDTNYITPHEAALAVVATAMKKARLHITTLIINAIMGGFLFSCGSILFIMIHSDSPMAQQNNPGLLNIIGGIAYGIGLFYVVIMGVDLYNSNILFFSVGVLRRAVSIWDLLISWSVSLFGNIAGSLFMSYVLVHLSTISQSENVIRASIEIGESKAAPSFIEVFLKGIGGNFFVCLAIYLQLLAKPLHVKLILLILPIFTFVTIGFSHTIADMGVMYTAMLNGANVTVGEYIWKVLIPTALGNAVGGFAFSFILPFYLHLVVVEYDRRQLSLPNYEARDEQPELNMDSRVVRITSQERDEFADIDEDSELTPVMTSVATGYNNEKEMVINSSDSDSDNLHHRPAVYSHHHDGNGVTNSNVQSSDDLRSSISALPVSLYSNNDDAYSVTPQPFPPHMISENTKEDSTVSSRTMRRYTTVSKDGKHHIRSPPGVFPVRGMGTPLTKEKSIVDPCHIDQELAMFDKESQSKGHSNGLLSRVHTNQSARSDMLERIKTLEREEQREYAVSGGYNVEESKPSALIGKALSRIITVHSANEHHDPESGLPRTTQDTFPFNHPNRAHSYDTSQMTEALGTGLRNTFSQRRRSFREVGVSDRAAMMANNIAGVDNYTPSDVHKHDQKSINSRIHQSLPRRFSELSAKSSGTILTQPIIEDKPFVPGARQQENLPAIAKREDTVVTYHVSDEGDDDCSNDDKSDRSSLNSQS